MVIAAQRHKHNADGLSFAILEALWRDDRDVADAAVLRELATRRGLNADQLVAEAMQPEVQAEFAANTEEAIKRGIIGSPTYFVGNEPFFGQDRLDFVERALAAL
jgi:2-hydroxychromene-2-carboxylate isomerase